MALFARGTSDTHRAVGLTIFGGAGLLALALPSALTIRVDRESGLLSLTYRSLLRRSSKEIPLHEIESVDIEDDRVVITERNGRVTPLRSYQERQASIKLHRQAKRLRELIGVGGSEPSLRMLTGQDEKVNTQIRRQQEALTGANDEMRETAGVRWSVQSTGMGRMPVTRWLSPDFKTNGTFVYIAQMPAQQPGGGMIGKWLTHGWIGKLAGRASMALYGFVGDDVPGSNAATIVGLDPPLDREFTAISPDAATARQILNPPVARALVDWAARHPLKTIQSGNTSEQLAVLFSPSGVYAATPGTLDPARLAELAATGTELVKAQRRNVS